MLARDMATLINLLSRGIEHRSHWSNDRCRSRLVDFGQQHLLMHQQALGLLRKRVLAHLVCRAGVWRRRLAALGRRAGATS